MESMIKKIILFFFLSMSLLGCLSVQERIDELNERIKGDGTPYIPGI